MIRTVSILTREERDILILGALCVNGRQLSNTEIGDRLGIPVTRVKTALHQACAKLEAHNRNEVIIFALKRGEISLKEIFSFEEVTERLGSLGSDTLRRMAHLVRLEMTYGCLLRTEMHPFPAERSCDAVLSQSERDVVILAGYGLKNKEIAERLFLSDSTVRTFLYRACAKLGSCRRADAVMLAIKRKEISIWDILSPDELVRILTPLGAEYIERVADRLDEKLEKEPELAGF